MEDIKYIGDLFEELVEYAYYNHVSDIHIEPTEHEVILKMRTDGVLLEYERRSKEVHPVLIARIKILGKMDIAEHRLPQDGQIRLMIGGERVSMRVSIYPMVFGEKAVIRLLTDNIGIDRMNQFGMIEEDYKKAMHMLQAPHGLVYLTGPTGSGKTTTLYMMLKELAKGNINIITLEDPIEQHLENINQSQVNYQNGLTFDAGLRAILRQDPDVIMVGETRDGETAKISVRAAMTGHLVLGTLHTNDALSALIRLKDMGVEPYMTAYAINGVIAQRLVRKLCPYCSIEIETDEKTRAYLGREIPKMRIAVGCPKCNQTGYVGRIAVHEVLCMDRTLREMIASAVGMEEMRRYAVKYLGMKTLKERGVELVEAGITSVDEMMKAAYYSDSIDEERERR